MLNDQNFLHMCSLRYNYNEISGLARGRNVVIVTNLNLEEHAGENLHLRIAVSEDRICLIPLNGNYCLQVTNDIYRSVNTEQVLMTIT